MTKPFSEAFPTFDGGSEFADILPHITVERVSTTPRRDILRIYLLVDRLIDKEIIFSLEKALKEQLFRGKDIKLIIYERFALSEQYTLENLIDAYWDSILGEFRARSRIDHTILKKAKVQVIDAQTLSISVKDGLTARDRGDEIIRILDKILNERCGIPATVSIDYVPQEEKREGADQDEPVVIITAPPSDTAEADGRDQDDASGQDAALVVPAESKSIKKSKPGSPSKAKKEDSENSDLIYGRVFDELPVPINDLTPDQGVVVIRGKVMKINTREIKNNRTIIMFDLADESDAIAVKIFARNEQAASIISALDPKRNDKNHEMKDVFVKVKGVPMMDPFDKELSFQSVNGILKASDFRVVRSDNSTIKRVELHCHTKMSDMDGVSDVKDIVKRAMQWGMPGIAITDHGVVQSFPDAAKTAEGDFKIIYGMEGYLVDDTMPIVENDHGQDFPDSTYVVFDIETTGLSPRHHKIIEIGAVKVKDGKIIDRFSEFINPKVPISLQIEKLTGINDSMVLEADTVEEVLPRFIRFCEGAVLVGHNVSFDISFILKGCSDLHLPFDPTTFDTLALSRIMLPRLKKYTLDSVAKHLKIDLSQHHRAVYDAECTAGIFLHFYESLKKDGKKTLAEVEEMNHLSKETIRRLRSHHIILLAKNTIGRSNLYRLVSRSHLDYMSTRPLIPRSLLLLHREGLILGSACVMGELYDALLTGRPDDEIARLVDFYDYLEIQPLGNNAFLVDSERCDTVQSMEDIKDINRRIVDLGKQFHKPVVATCDSHFLDPEDQILRTIIMSGRGFDEETPAPLFLRTTEEMLREFEYLGSDTAKEVVITNTRKIFDMCEAINPIRPDKCPPVIEDSDQTLERICRSRAEKIYGSPLPPIVRDRMERELHDIIKNGYAVMYIIAQKLVWKSVEDGYLVGSRGSVGSSFAAYLAEITEVNSLQPHYVCPACKYSDFESPEVLAYRGHSGCDMPDKICPRCGTKLRKDGFDIPFETFMGFSGDKEPDIDLNFSGEYQSKAHEYTKVIFGADQTFRAGTIQTIAEKTAYGYVKKYYEEHGDSKRRAEVERVVWDILGIRRGTGQHPGGIVVLPIGEDIDTITPVQHPPKQKKGENSDDLPDESEKTITTHFDYHKIEQNLLKLDILGHDDPTMIRFFLDNTDVDPVSVPLDDPKVMSLFQDTSALGITPADIRGTKLGCLGIPEFGTDFAMQMVVEAKPTSVSHLIRISGLSHGESVWAGNAQDLISEGTATIDTAICTRDDIMTYLIGQGMKEDLAFKTMESVRKGKGLKPEMTEAMTACNVPQWYIDSCLKIKYMFPKAHAAAYVMMAWRIAWFKVYRPAAFYAAWFSIRAKAFSYQDMCCGLQHMKNRMAEIENKENDKTQKLEDKEKNLLYSMRIAEEMYARGLTFAPIDLSVVRSRQFQVIDDKTVMPSLTSLDNMGATAADSVVTALKSGPFLSKEDVRQRTKAPAKVIDAMSELGILKDLPESNQMSLFDYIS